MVGIRILGGILLLVGGLMTVFGLWSVAGGLRVVVSGRIDERKQSGKAAKIGIPFAVVGVVLLFVGIWFSNWGG
jgi:hypothetical protein